MMDREYLDKQDEKEVELIDERMHCIEGNGEQVRSILDKEGVTNSLMRTRLRAFRSTHTLYKDGDKDVPEAICDRNGQVALAQCRNCGRGEIELDEPCDHKKLITALHSRVKQQEEAAAKAMITLNNVIAADGPFSEMCSKMITELNEAFFHGGVK